MKTRLNGRILEDSFRPQRVRKIAGSLLCLSKSGAAGKSLRGGTES